MITETPVNKDVLAEMVWPDPCGCLTTAFVSASIRNYPARWRGHFAVNKEIKDVLAELMPWSDTRRGSDHGINSAGIL